MSRVYLVLDAVSGPFAGHSVHCVDHQETTFGRTDAATIVLADDFFLSRLHFCVEYDNEEGVWRLRDLESRHGTMLNGEQVDNARLTPGDELKAGKTEFRVDSIQEGGIKVSVVVGAAAAMFAALVASDRSPAAKPEYERLECASGLVTLTGAGSEPTPAGIGWLLARESPLFLLADFAKTSRPLPLQLEQVDFLFNWMDDDVLPFCSPILLGPEDPVDPYEVIDEFWGDDAVMCLYSELDKKELLLRLRAAIRRDDGTATTIPRGMFGYCWPEAARSVLASAPEKLTQPLMDCARAVLLEAESPDCWQIFCSEGDEQRTRSGLEI